MERIDEILKCYNKLKPSLDKNVSDKFNYRSVNNFLDKLGFDQSEIRSLYSLNLTDGNGLSIVPYHWLDLFFKDYTMTHSGGMGFTIQRDVYLHSIIVNVVEKKVWINDFTLIHSLMDFYGINPNELSKLLEEWFRMCYNIPHLMYVKDFEMIISGYENTTSYKVRGGYAMFLNSAYSSFGNDQIYDPYNDTIENREEIYRSFMYPNYKIRFND